MPLRELIVADRPDGLDKQLAAIADLDPVGVDVERADWNRYFRSPALVQVGGDGRVVIVDPLALDDLEPLQAFLRERRVVFHAIENDLPPLMTRGIDPPWVEDTALAAAMLGLPTGLATLLEELLGVQLVDDKSAMQRADWEARPIPDDMLAYAAADVADLPALWEVLAARLDERDRTTWYREELEALLGQPSVEERRAWHRVKGVGRLDRQARARMHALWATRERLARRTNTAPSRIAGDKVLMDLAVRPPRGTGELGRRGMRRQAVRDFGEDLLEALEDPPTPPPPDRRRRPTDDDRATVDELRALRSDIAEELGIDAGVLCPSRTLMTAVLTDPDDGEALRRALGLRRWQWEQLGPAFCEALGLPMTLRAHDD